MRKNIIIPLILLVVLVTVFNIFFLDKIIRLVLIKSGEQIFRAKVEISTLKTKFSNLAIKISGLAVADKDNPMRNLLEIKEIYFGIMPRPLLEGKFVVEKMEVSGVTTNTARKTSGALPPKRLKKISRKTSPGVLDKIWEKSTAELRKTTAFSTWQDIKSISLTGIEDKVAASETLNTIAHLKSTSEKKISDYEASGNNLAIAELTRETADNLNAAKNLRIDNIQDISAAENLLKKLQGNQQKISAVAGELARLKSSLSADLNSNDYLQQVNQAKEKDYQNTWGKVNLSGLSSPSAIGKSLLGPVWMTKVDRAIYYLSLVKRYTPKKKSPTKPRMFFPRRRGQDFVFPKENFYPKFWIKKVVVAGRISETDFSGEILDITSGQEVINRPTIARISGRSKSGVLAIDAVFDYRREPEINKVNIVLGGIPQPEYNLPGEIKLAGRRMDSQNMFLLAGSSFTAEIGIKISEPEFKTSTGTFWLRYLQNIPVLNLTARVEKVAEDFKIDFHSNVDGILKQRISDEFGAMVAAYQEKIKREVDRQVKEKQEELLSGVAGRKKEILARYDSEIENIRSREREIQKAIDEVKNRVQQQTGRQIDDKKLKELKGLLPR